MRLSLLFPDKIFPSYIRDLEISGINRDSRGVNKGDLFFIIKGENFNVYDVLSEVEEKVSAFVAGYADRDIVSSLVNRRPIIYVGDPVKNFRRAADIFYDYPQRGIEVTGITGTNGKTTVTHLIYSILRGLKMPAASIGTINCLINDKPREVDHTTPDYVSLREIFRDIKDAGVNRAVMEVSSHAIDQGRIDGLEFSQCVFTNLSRDHLDYHKDMKSYFKAKKDFFGNNPGAVSVINVSDSYGERLNKEIKSPKVTYSSSGPADLSALDITVGMEQTRFSLACRGKIYPLVTSLPGRHNVDNILAAVAAVINMGIQPEKILEMIPLLSCPMGRLELLGQGIFVDYAHTPDALARAITALKDMGYKKVTVVFGCGGNRDQGKRKIMGEVSCEKADYTIITSDNPRNEDPDKICAQIAEGFTGNNYTIIRDRGEAIKKAVGFRKKDHAVLVAGKGHERYQILGEKRIPFSDQEFIKELI